MIELRNVSKTYTMGEEQIHALDKVNLTIGKGEFVSIVGPSGSRKVYPYECNRAFRCARRRRVFAKWA